MGNGSNPSVVTEGVKTARNKLGDSLVSFRVAFAFLCREPFQSVRWSRDIRHVHWLSS